MEVEEGALPLLCIILNEKRVWSVTLDVQPTDQALQSSQPLRPKMSENLVQNA